MNCDDLSCVFLYCHLKEIMDGYNNGEGISANLLSQEIGERRSTLNDLITNKDMDSRRIPARLIAKLCVFFGVTPADIFTVEYVNEIETKK